MNYINLKVVPISFSEAKKFVIDHHRHHKSLVGWKFGCGLQDSDDNLVGVVIVGRPVNRNLDDGLTLEVTRCCTLGDKNACTILYSRAIRAAKALGYRRLVTYTLEDESGASLKASNFIFIRKTKGGSWNTKCRPRKNISNTQPKLMWEMKW